MNPFTRHPTTVGESYVEHLGVATRFGARMILGGFGALIHGILPFLCTTTASRTVDALHAEMVRKRGAKAEAETQKRTVEYVI